MSKRDYYEVLGVIKSASAEEVKEDEDKDNKDKEKRA